MYQVYILKTDLGVPFYVGAGNEDRVKRHLRGSGGRHLVDEIIREHRERGSDILFEIDSEHECKGDSFKREIDLIGEIGKISDGGTLVNICDGGAGVNGLRHSNEYKAKKSEMMKQRFRDESERIKTSEATKKAMVDHEIRKKCRDGVVSAWANPEYRSRQVAAHTGKKDSEETKSKKSKSCAKSWDNGSRKGKYTDDQVMHVYSLKNTSTPKDVSEIYGMNPTYVSKIWRHERCKMALIRLGIIK